MTLKWGYSHIIPVSRELALRCWWRHNRSAMTSQWPDNCDANTWQVISNSLEIDFIHGDIHGGSYKNDTLLTACIIRSYLDVRQTGIQWYLRRVMFKSIYWLVSCFTKLVSWRWIPSGCEVITNQLLPTVIALIMSYLTGSHLWR